MSFSPHVTVLCERFDYAKGVIIIVNPRIDKFNGQKKNKGQKDEIIHTIIIIYNIILIKVITAFKKPVTPQFVSIYDREMFYVRTKLIHVQKANN